MSSALFQTDRNVTLLGAGPASDAQLDQALSVAPALVAADGGADRARQYGATLNAVIGDLDSLTSRERWQESGVSVHHVADQDTTDFEKCLYRVTAPLYIAVGFLGARTDHHLAALNALVKFADKRVILIGDEDVICHCPSRFSLKVPVDSRISLFPMRPVSGVSSRGLNWPIDGLAMAPGGQIGTSNHASAETVEIALDGRGCLLILPRTQLAAMIAALS